LRNCAPFWPAYWMRLSSEVVRRKRMAPEERYLSDARQA
jgi:hypothetical protein